MNRYERMNQERKIVDVRKRVAAYCRVSTDHEDQANSFESQQRYFRQYIERNPDWELYEIFADEGISGTNTKKRSEFKRMIACAKFPVLREIRSTASITRVTSKSTASA